MLSNFDLKNQEAFNNALQIQYRTYQLKRMQEKLNKGNKILTQKNFSAPFLRITFFLLTKINVI